MKRTLIAFLIGTTAVCTVAQSTTRKKLRASKPVAAIEQPEATQVCDTIDRVDSIKDVVRLSGYKKAVASRVESVMLTNLSATDTIHAYEIDIDYRTPGGQQLNRRVVTIKTIVPPGETRHASFNSWDRQQLFYHTSTPPTRKTGRTAPFTVTITPRKLIVAHTNNTEQH